MLYRVVFFSNDCDIYVCYMLNKITYLLLTYLLIVHIYKRQGDRAVCDNHRGIHLMSVAGKVLARVLLNRLRDHGQLCHYTGNPVWLPGGQMCHDNDLLSHTDTREVLREASRSLYGIY